MKAGFAESRMAALATIMMTISRATSTTSNFSGTTTGTSRRYQRNNVGSASSTAGSTVTSQLHITVPKIRHSGHCCRIPD